MKNIIIAGASRTGKSSLAKRINEKYHHFAISLDKLVFAFQEAYPQLDIILNWNREKTAENLAPFIGHFIGMFSSADGRGLLPYSHGEINENKFLLEGAYFNFDKIFSILKTYGKEDLKNNFILIGLVQKNKTVDEFVRDFKKYDTINDWTYNFDDNELKEIAEDFISFNNSMYEHLIEYGFTIYDTSIDREQVFDKIINDINRWCIN